MWAPIFRNMCLQHLFQEAPEAFRGRNAEPLARRVIIPGDRPQEKRIDRMIHMLHDRTALQAYMLHDHNGFFLVAREIDISANCPQLGVRVVFLLCTVSDFGTAPIGQCRQALQPIYHICIHAFENASGDKTEYNGASLHTHNAKTVR